MKVKTQKIVMSMIFQLWMIGTEDEDFLREYELPYTMNLIDFHRFICDDVRYDPMSMASFFLSNERWEKGQEYTLMDMGAGSGEFAPAPMEKTTLGQILHKNNDRLIYVFDQFGDRCLFLELMGTIKRQDGVEYPRVALSAGDPPRQFELEAIAATGDSIFETAMDDFYDFDGDDFYDDDF